MDKKFRKMKKKKYEILACMYKSKKNAQSQQNLAPSQDGETVTFRNSAYK